MQINIIVYTQLNKSEINASQRIINASHKFWKSIGDIICSFMT